MHRKFKKNLRFKKIYLSLCSQKQWWVRITVSTRDSQSRNRSSILLPTTKRRGRLKKVGLFFVKFEVSQRQQQIASGKRRIFEGAPYQKRLPLTKNSALFVRSGPFHYFLHPANAELVSDGSFPLLRGWTGLSEATATRFSEMVFSFLAV